MTQGTKVGLLVSLVFLIVILVLLSDHVATSSDARPAQVTLAGPQVAQGITTPGPQAVEPPRLVAAASDMAPAHPVPIVQEMITRQAPPPQIDIGPAQTGQLDIRSANSNVPVNVRVAPVQVGPGASVLRLADAGRLVEPVLSNDFIPVGPNPVSAVQTPLLTVAPPAAPKSFDYTALPGDTVSKMARKYYGLDTKTNRELIIAANRNLKSNPNKIEVGKSYLIPVKAGSISAAQAAAAPLAAALPTIAMKPTAAAIPAPPAAIPTPAERTYTVKAGDNLWKIAKEQCKDIGQVDELKKLNAGVLKSSADLKVGMKLRLPPSKKE